MSRAGCLSDAVLQGLIDSTLSREARAEALAHVDACPDCREVMAVAAPAILERSPAADDDGAGSLGLVRGMTVGRYLVMDLVGAGAMGEVHSAYDPQLDRRVALKILREPGGDLKGRLVREARAMARLSHPNVVSVYDAGTYGDRVFVAMEYIEGASLAAWLRARPRSARETVAVFSEAGRGLAAAHALGMVHRDFKPENVLVASDGRVRVADFGLARLAGGVERGWPRPASPVESLSLTGALAGTPAYMAPEQMVGGQVTPASDQFSFCVALHEGLYGRRPFTGKDLGELLASIRAGELAIPASPPVPAAVRRALRRGLAADPSARFPSMGALLAALQDAPASRWRRAGLALAAAACLATGGLLAGRARTVRAQLCRGADAEIAATWSPARAAAVRAALVAGGQSYAGSVAATFAHLMDDYAARWAGARTAACEATQIAGVQSADLLDRRIRCYDRARQDLGALLDVFSHPGPGLADRAVAAVFRLPALAECDAGPLLASRAPPARDPASVEALRGVLARARALIAAGRYEPALAVARLAVAAARAVADAAVEAEAELTLADGEAEHGPLAAAIASYGLAIDAAAAAGDDATAAHALTGRGQALGRQARLDDARASLRQAARIAARLGDARLAAQLVLEDGRLHFAEGDYAGALALADRAYRQRAALDGGDHPDVSAAVSLRGRANRMLGRLAKARADYEQALAIEERLLGGEHPGLIADLNNLGNTVWEDAADYAQAKRIYERALALALAAGPGDFIAGNELVSLGQVNADLGDYRTALAQIERGLPLLDAGLGPESPNAVYGHVARAQVLTVLGRYAAALAEHDRALELRRRVAPGRFDEAYSLMQRALTLARAGRAADARRDAAAALAICARLFGPDHPGLASAQHADCDVRLEVGDDARASCAAALAATERALGPEHPEVIATLVSLGEADLEAGDSGRARPAFERAVAYFDRHPGNLGVRARARFALARISGDRQLARAARLDLLQIGSDDPRALAALDRWLAR